MSRDKVESRGRQGVPCCASWKPLLLNTARWHHEYLATIHWTHAGLDGVPEYGGSILSGPVLPSAPLAYMDPPRAASVFKLGLQVVVLFMLSNYDENEIKLDLGFSRTS